MSVLEKIKSGLIWSLLARVFGAGSGFLVTALMARILSIEALGIYYLVLNLIRFGSHFVKVGMEISLQKSLGVASTDKNWGTVALHIGAMGSIMAGSAVALLVVMLVAWQPLVSNLLDMPVLLPMLFVVFLLVLFRSVEEVGSAFFRGVHEARIGVFLIDGPRQAVMLILLAFIYWQQVQLSAEQAVHTYFLSSLAAVAFIIFLGARWCRKHEIFTHWPTFAQIKLQGKKDFSLSSPMMLQGIAALINSTFDIWVLGIFSTKEDVAVYGTVVRLVSLIMLVMSVGTMVIPPLMAALYEKKDRIGIERLLQTMTTYSALIIVPMVLLFLAFGKPLLTLMFGEQFESGYSVLCILSIGYGFMALTGCPGWLLQMAGQHRNLMRTSLTVGVLNMMANIFAAQHWGAMGVAVVSASAIMLQELLNIYFAYKKLAIRTWFNPFRRIETV
jgi:O-antigen/teichoic acid export membrane protein